MKPISRLRQSLRDLQTPRLSNPMPSLSLGIFANAAFGGRSIVQVAESIPLPVHPAGVSAELRRRGRFERKMLGKDYRISLPDWLASQPNSTRKGFYRGRIKLPWYVR